MVSVSIIVPIYKVEKYLNRCINSLLQQTLKNIEIILVDDGSPDRCPEICDCYSKIDKRIKVIHQRNAGVSSARNTGIKVSTGEFIGFVDADDYVASEMFEHLYKYAKKYNVLVSCCDLCYLDDEGKILSGSNNGIQIISGEKLFSKMLDTKGFLRMGVWNKIYHRELLKDVKFDTNIHMAEDMIFLLNIIPKQYKISYVRKGMYFYYRQRMGAATSERYGELEKERLKNTQYMADYIHDKYPDIYPQAVSYKCINGGLTAINKMIESDYYDGEMVVMVKQDLRNSMKALRKSDISRFKLFQLYLCAYSFSGYKVLYNIHKWRKNK